MELGEYVVGDVFGSCAHCARSIYSLQESGLGLSLAGAAAAAAAVDVAGFHNKVQRGNNTGHLHSQTWGSRL